MSIKTLVAAATLAIAAAAAGTPVAQAQNFLGMDLNRLNQGFNNRQNGQMGALQGQIVQQNINDPRVMEMYRQNNRGMTPQQFAYMYGATGGFSGPGMAAYNNTSRQIAGNEQAAWQRYQAAQGGAQAALQAQRDGYFGNQYRQGMMLGGWNNVPRTDYWYRQGNPGLYRPGF